MPAGEEAGDQHIGIDDRPDHFTPPGVTGSCLRRCAVISASISAGVKVSSPRRLAPLQAFSSQSGGGAAVRMKSCTLMMTTAGSTAAVDDEALIVLGGEVHDLAELGTRDMGVDAAIHLSDPFMD